MKRIHTALIILLSTIHFNIFAAGLGMPPAKTDEPDQTIDIQPETPTLDTNQPLNQPSTNPNTAPVIPGKSNLDTVKTPNQNIIHNTTN